MSDIHGYYICGTDTGIGKTYAACTIVDHLRRRGLRVSVMKPVASGCCAGRNDDAQRLIAASGLTLPYPTVNPYALTAAIAPHLAAAIDGQTIEAEVIERALGELASQGELVIVEGVGGVAVPLGDDCLQTDLIARLQLPVILVVAIRLGCINHALLSIAYLEARNIPVAGWVANLVDPDSPCQQANIDTLVGHIKKPLLGTIGYQQGFLEDKLLLPGL